MDYTLQINWFAMLSDIAKDTRECKYLSLTLKKNGSKLKIYTKMSLHAIVNKVVQCVMCAQIVKSYIHVIFTDIIHNYVKSMNPLTRLNACFYSSS